MRSAGDDAEGTIEEFSEFYAQFKRLLRLGVPFDRDFADRVERMNAGARGADDDGDQDDADEFIDLDSSDGDDQLVDVTTDTDEDADSYQDAG